MAGKAGLLRPWRSAAKNRAAALLLSAFLILPWALPAQVAATARALPSPPAINARAAVLIDAATGTLLFAKNPDLALPPASLTKLVTLHIALEEIAAGRLSYEEILEIDPRDCSPQIPYGSSIMYLYPKMKVSVRDLMLGAAVVSGNDAAYALARRISGSNEAFAARMNQELKDLGFDGLTFEEPSGLSERNLVSARQFAQFCKLYMELHPRALKELHSVKSIEFPRQEHSAPGYVPEGRIVQYNRNPLIFNYPGADGLKTGYIIEVGFNMAATAQREGTRFIVVTLGGTGTAYSSGGNQRTKDVTNLLDWAFKNFATVSMDPGPLPEPRAWFGRKRTVALKMLQTNAVTVPRDRIPELNIRVAAPASVDAPVERLARIGRLTYYLGDDDVAVVDLVASEAVPRGNIFRRVFDGIVRFFVNIFGAKDEGRKN
ncbi:MAG: D-alanyl-D-alanine carboxypeptidase family protein [Spirochaetota bacterium]